MPSRNHHHHHHHQSLSSNDPSLIPTPRQILNSIAPQLMSNQILTSNSFLSSFNRSNLNLSTPSSFRSSNQPSSSFDLSKLIKLLLPQSLGGRGGVQLNDLLITDQNQINQLLKLELPSPTSSSSSSSSSNTLQPHPSSDLLSLIDGFQASLPSSIDSKINRRRRRAEIGHKLLGYDHSHSISDSPNSNNNTSEPLELPNHPSSSSSSSSHRRKSSTGLVDRQSLKKNPARRRKTDIIGRSKTRLSSSSSSSPSSNLNKADISTIKEMIPELEFELSEIRNDQANLQIRKELISKDLKEIDLKIFQLTQLKEDLQASMLSLREDELELIDEYEGISDRLAELQERLPLTDQFPQQQPHQLARRPPRISSTSSRRLRGPAFLPSEHDQLPKNVSFMTLRGHSQPITALDFSCPYGYLVSSSSDQSVQVWDLASGEAIQSLEGHVGMVKCLQVEDMTCITGGLDGQIRVWDLDYALDGDSKLEEFDQDLPRNSVNGLVGHQSDDKLKVQDSSDHGSCVMKLEGHSRSVTALYFDDACLVTGSSDKTIRQWDLNTGQAVMTMDLLWAMQDPLMRANKSFNRRQLRAPSSTISDFEFGGDGYLPSSISWTRSPSSRASSKYNGLFTDEEKTRINSESLLKGTLDHSEPSSYEHVDFIGGIQFWGYALASGSGDCCVRMWDMRTGQAHRTLAGHFGPITCLQFDEIHLVSGSTDKTIKIWDLRTGGVTETIKYNGPITSLQFDSRKVMCTAGDKSIHVYNRTTLQRSTIEMNGHTDAVERLRYMDRYMVTGSKDAMIKIWSI